MTLLVATAVEAEAEAIRAGLARGATTVPADLPHGATTVPAGLPDGAATVRADLPHGAATVRVAAVGVGPAAAAAGTARLLALAEAAGRPFRAVIGAGIAGGFPGRAEIGATVLATRTIAADLGAETPDGFLPIERLGFGTSGYESDSELFKKLTAALPDARAGDILTLATVTGTAATAAELARRHPAALAEAMEGYGVASAARAAGLPFLEVRTVSNLIGPRDRSSWRLADALEALTAVGAALAD